MPLKNFKVNEISPVLTKTAIKILEQFIQFHS